MRQILQIDDPRSRIEALVYELLELINKRPRAHIDLTCKLIPDLGLNGDLITFFFIPWIEKTLGIDIPSKEWETVITGEDVCKLLERFVKLRL